MGNGQTIALSKGNTVLVSGRQGFYSWLFHLKGDDLGKTPTFEACFLILKMEMKMLMIMIYKQVCCKD